LAPGLVGQQPVAHRVHQVGLAQADAAVDEQRVVQLARHAGHVHGRGARHAVGRALDQGVESEAVLSRFLKPAGGRRLRLASAGRAGSSVSESLRLAGAVSLAGFSRGASANSSCTGWPYSFSSMAAMRPAYWARTQSSLKRLATNSVTLEKSSETWRSGA
jgi:hypothetical protein